MQINEEYKVESDDLNIILLKKYAKKKKDESDPIEYDYRPIGYYPNLEMALKGMCKKEIFGTGFTDFETIIAKIEELHKVIEGLKLK